MTSIRMSFAAAALLAGFAASAVAQAPATAPATPSTHAHARMDSAKAQQRTEQRMQRMQRHMDALKQKLQIAPAQESAWTAFTSALQPAGRTQRPDRKALARLTTPERLDQLRTLRQQRMATMDQRAEATKAFYAALTPEQQKTFDELTPRRPQRTAGHHRGHPHNHHGQHHHHHG